ncbi:MAG: FtsX-like permease family protein [Gemmatimonadetes bacterium]|nr:FtsX-like permease family protein [Gemmatimonadota bacterium]
MNDALARMFWPDEDPVGKELQGDPAWRVVGVVADVQMRSLRRRARPAVYYPMSRSYRGGMVLHLRGESGQSVQPELLRQTVADLDLELPVSAVVDLEKGLAASMGETRTIGYLIAAFAVLALVLAAVGLYGLVSYGASQRVREMGIRIALGAPPQSLVRLILTRGVRVSALGIGAGLAVSYGLGKALEGLLFGVAPADSATIGAASVLLLLTAGVASWVPARRASRLDPAISLRE